MTTPASAAAMMPMMATVMISSSRVKPSSRRSQSGAAARSVVHAVPVSQGLRTTMVSGSVARPSAAADRQPEPLDARVGSGSAAGDGAVARELAAAAACCAVCPAGTGRLAHGGGHL